MERALDGAFFGRCVEFEIEKDKVGGSVLIRIRLVKGIWVGGILFGGRRGGESFHSLNLVRT